jgi:antibiotic biosynthesis monooxygenase (ABM) superfamily enzyme
MIARVWRGWTAQEDADAYVEYLDETGMRESRALPGNLGAMILRRDDGDRTEFKTVILWDDLGSIRAFAGDELERAVFFPEDDRFLVERDEHVVHFEVAKSL